MPFENSRQPVAIDYHTLRVDIPSYFAKRDPAAGELTEAEEVLVVAYSLSAGGVREEEIASMASVKPMILRLIIQSHEDKGCRSILLQAQDILAGMAEKAAAPNVIKAHEHITPSPRAADTIRNTTTNGRRKTQATLNGASKSRGTLPQPTTVTPARAIDTTAEDALYEERLEAQLEGMRGGEAFRFFLHAVLITFGKRGSRD